MLAVASPARLFAVVILFLSCALSLRCQPGVEDSSGAPGAESAKRRVGSDLSAPPKAEKHDEAKKEASRQGGLRAQLEEADPTLWTRLYLPDKAYNGYNLVFFRKRIPLLLDMNGNIVHSWLDVRASERIRLLQNGNLLALTPEDTIKEYDWDGRLVWSFARERSKDFPHHDLIELGNGNILLLYRDDKRRSDYLLEVNRDSEIEWQWHSNDYLQEHFRGKIRFHGDPTHINSVQELPDNRWFEAGDSRFRPGSLLISARNLNTVFILERQSGDIVWQYDSDLDNQHEAYMIEEGYPGAGNILIFNNGLESIYRYRRSAILEIDPVAKQVVWDYDDPTFFSSVGGVQQRLPNGNTLIGSTSGERAFEVDPEGNTVWEYVPPLQPIRPFRYPENHCPQFKDLPPARGETELPSDWQPFIDEDLYRYGLSHQTTVSVIDGVRRRFLKEKSGRRVLLLPDKPTLWLKFGLYEQDTGTEGIEPFEVAFAATIKRLGESNERTLLREVLTQKNVPMCLLRRYELDEYARETVVLRLDTQVTGDPRASRFVRWEESSIDTPGPGADREKAFDTLPDDRPSDLILQRLKALGYVE